jgi:flavin reductase (DIM6/NTAB) family NADH-FMN oxidoreductase RutF
MVNTVAYEDYSQQFLKQLPKGAFLTVKDRDLLNTMTIGWGSIGYIWQKPTLMVMVRYSRYTYELINKAKDFSVSLPSPGELKKSLAFTGTKSGRDIDKFKAANLTVQAAHYIESPVIGECGLIFECQLVFKQVMEPDNLDKSIRENCYPQDDYHVMYYGEILACYRQDHE